MKALITGINGQDGAYLTAFLLEKGYKVVGIARKNEPMPNLDYTLKGKGKPHIHYGDIAEPEFVNHVMKTEKPDEVYNLAAQSHVGTSFNSPLTTMSVNYGGLVNFINANKQHFIDAKVYQAGTSEMFGDKNRHKLDETSPFSPKSPYGIAKLAAHYAGINAREQGMWVSNGILFNHESPIRGEDFVTRKITKGVARIMHGSDEPIRLGNLSSKRDWGFAGDYVRGMWQMLQHNEPDDFVLATSETYSIEEFVTMAFDSVGVHIVFSGEGIDRVGHDMATGKKLVVVDPKFYRPNDLNYLLGDYSKANVKLGWQPEVKIKQLVTMMVTEDLRRA